MNKSARYSPEVRKCAVRVVFGHQGEYPSRWSAMESTAPRVGCTAEKLRKWVRQAELDQGLRTGLTTSDRARRGHTASKRSTTLHRRLDINETGVRFPSPGGNLVTALDGARVPVNELQLLMGRKRPSLALGTYFEGKKFKILQEHVWQVTFGNHVDGLVASGYGNCSIELVASRNRRQSLM